jgi:anti-anti-sigma factor
MSTTGEVGDVTFVVQTTEIDLTSADAFDAELEVAVNAAVAADALRLILDFSAVQFMDSGGISHLIDARNRLGEARCRLELQHVQRPVERSLDVLGLKTAFAVI